MTCGVWHESCCRTRRSLRRMKILIPVILTFVLISCGSAPKPAPPPMQTMQPQTTANAPPPVVAEQPFPPPPQGSSPRDVPRPSPAAEPDAQTAAAVPAPRAEVTIPSGTPIHVRLNQALDTRRNRAGDKFTATLAKP